MTERTKGLVSASLNAMNIELGSLERELEELRDEVEAGFANQDTVPPLSQLDENLASRFNLKDDLKSRVDKFFDDTLTAMIDVTVDGERDYLRRVNVKSNDFINEINNI